MVHGKGSGEDGGEEGWRVVVTAKAKAWMTFITDYRCLPTGNKSTKYIDARNVCEGLRFEYAAAVAETSGDGL